MNTAQGFSGEATATYPNGDSFKGNFIDGKRDRGLYTYKDGTEYEGAFRDDKKHGKGSMKFANNARFQGYFKEGIREGEGTFKYANGDIYSGQFTAGKKHGTGTYVYAGTKYHMTGEWMEGQFVKGIWEFTNGTKYIGNFAQQKPAGDGIWQTKDGTAIEGAYLQQVVPVDDAPPPQPGEEPKTTTNIFWKTAMMAAVEENV